MHEGEAEIYSSRFFFMFFKALYVCVCVVPSEVLIHIHAWQRSEVLCCPLVYECYRAKGRTVVWALLLFEISDVLPALLWELLESCSKQKDKQVHCFLIVKQASSYVAKNATCYGILHPAYQSVIMGAEEPKLDVWFIEQFYASTEEKESVARPSVHSQTTLVQGQRRKLTS